MRYNRSMFRILFIYLFCYSVSAARASELVIYTYESLSAHGGWLSKISEPFEKKCNCKLKIVSVGDGGQLVGRLQLDRERKKEQAHILLGFDQNLWSKLSPWLNFQKTWKPSALNYTVDEIHKLKLNDLEGFIAFDYGVFAFMADLDDFKKRKILLPQSLTDLLKPEYKKLFVLQDPRMSTPGLGFLLYTLDTRVNPQSFELLKKLKNQWLALSPSWDASYSMFTHGEVPMVWSYSTSQAYHEEHGDNVGRFKAIEFNEGQPIQLEGVAITDYAQSNPEILGHAKNFVEFLLSSEAQSQIPKTQWMLPVRKDVQLPKSFSHLFKPKKLIPIQLGKADLQELLKKWHEAVQ